MKNALRSGWAKKAILFAFILGVVSPSALAYPASSYSGPVSSATSGTSGYVDVSTYQKTSGTGNSYSAAAYTAPTATSNSGNHYQAASYTGPSSTTSTSGNSYTPATYTGPSSTNTPSSVTYTASSYQGPVSNKTALDVSQYQKTEDNTSNTVGNSYVAYNYTGPVSGTTSTAAIAPDIMGLNVTPSSYNPDQGGVATVSFRQNTRSETTVWIKDSNDTIVQTLLFDLELTSTSTPYEYDWNGKRANGTVVPAGTYTAQVYTHNVAGDDLANYTFTVTRDAVTERPDVSLSVSPTSFNVDDNEDTTITYTLSNDSADLSVKIKDGSSTVRTLKTLSSTNVGTYTVDWNGLNDANQKVDAKTYTVEVYAVNSAGDDIATRSVSVLENQAGDEPNISSLNADPDPFDPEDEDTEIEFYVDQAADITVEIREGNSTIRTLDNGTFRNAGTYRYDWDGRDSSGNQVDEDIYTVYVEAENSDGDDTATTTVRVDYDNGGGVSCDIIGTHDADPDRFDPDDEDTLIRFTMDRTAEVTLRIYDNNDDIVERLLTGQTFTSGTKTISWDGEDGDGDQVRDGRYEYVIIAVDDNDSSCRDEVTGIVRVDSDGNDQDEDWDDDREGLIRNLEVDPDRFDPDDDDEVEITFELTDDVDKLIVDIVEKGDENVIYTIEDATNQDQDDYEFQWDGRDEDGDVVADDEYDVRVRAEDEDGDTDTDRACVAVDTGGSRNECDDDEDDWPSTDEGLVRIIEVDPAIFDPTDGERSEIVFELTEDVERLKVQVMDGNRVVETLRDTDDVSEGEYAYEWDGRDDDNDRVRDDLYQFRVMADDGDDTDTDRAYVEVDTDGIIIGFPEDHRCAGFRDVSIYSPFCKAIELMSARNIFDGYSDGTFRPYQAINRAETTKVVTLALGYDVRTGGYYGNQFSDTIANAWYAPYLDTALRNDIIHGYPDGTFRPSNTINRVELLKIFLRAHNLSNPRCAQPYLDTPVNADTDWYMPYACYAKQYNLIGGSYLRPGEPMTRGDVADLFYQFEIRGEYEGYGSSGVDYTYQYYDDVDDYYNDRYDYDYDNYYGYSDDELRYVDGRWVRVSY